MSTKKMAILTASPEVIRELLQLPDGVTLIGMHVPFDKPGVLELKIEGAGLEVSEGTLIYHVPESTIKTDENGNKHIEWNLPEE